MLAMVIFCFPPISMPKEKRVTFIKLLIIKPYKWQTSYRTCIKYVLDKSAFSTLSTFYFIACEVAAVHSLVLFTLTLSHIIATRVGLDSSCMTCMFKKFIVLCNQTTATKKDLGPFKTDRAVVDSNRSVNLPFDIRKILCTYPRKRKDIRGLQMFLLSDRRPVIVPGWRADLHPARRFVCFMVG